MIPPGRLLLPIGGGPYDEQCLWEEFSGLIPSGQLPEELPGLPSRSAPPHNLPSTGLANCSGDKKTALGIKTAVGIT
jgi:hypothetical protein